MKVRSDQTQSQSFPAGRVTFWVSRPNKRQRPVEPFGHRNSREEEQGGQAASWAAESRVLRGA